MKPRAPGAFIVNDTLPSRRSAPTSVAIPERKRSDVPPVPSTTRTSPSTSQLRSAAPETPCAAASYAVAPIVTNPATAIAPTFRIVFPHIQISVVSIVEAPAAAGRALSALTPRVTCRIVLPCRKQLQDMALAPSYPIPGHLSDFFNRVDGDAAAATFDGCPSGQPRAAARWGRNGSPERRWSWRSR